MGEAARGEGGVWMVVGWLQGARLASVCLGRAWQQHRQGALTQQVTCSCALRLFYL